MCNFGEVAFQATQLLSSAYIINPRKAWQAAAEACGCSPSMIAKGCPRSAYLGLCEAGLVKGVAAPTGRWTRSVDNKRYAIHAIKALRRDGTLRGRPAELWREATRPRTIVHNGQIDVVLRLWDERLIEPASNEQIQLLDIRADLPP